VWDYPISSVEKKRKNKEEKMSIGTAVHCITHCRREEKEREWSSIFRLTSMCCRSLYISYKVIATRDVYNWQKNTLELLLILTVKWKIDKRVWTPTYTRILSFFFVLLYWTTCMHTMCIKTKEAKCKHVFVYKTMWLHHIIIHTIECVGAGVYVHILSLF
jgi:hypothetical protein